MNAGTERYYGLDALRGGMMLLGIVLHTATMHALEIAAIGAKPSALILATLGVIHQFRMPLFFMLAGFFMALLVRKYGLSGALDNRGKRILIPFLLCLVSIVPLTDWLFFSIYYSSQQQTFALIGPNTDLESVFSNMRTSGVPAQLTLFHLWFLYYLIIFVAAVPLLEKGIVRLEQHGMLVRIRKLAASPWTSLPLCAALTAITLIPFTAAAVAVNDKLFVPALANLGYYGLFFALGYLFFHCRIILDTFKAHTGTYGVLAFLFFVWYAIPAGMAGAGSQSVVIVVLAKLFAGFSTWCFIYFLCGLFLNRYNADTPHTRLLSQSAYWVYLLHMPVILFTGIVLMNLPVDIGPHLRMLLNMAFTTWVCFGSYKYAVRSTWLGALLNGHRFDTNGRTIKDRGQSKNPDPGQSKTMI